MRYLGGSCMSTISDVFLLFSRIMSVSVLFFLTFCENIFRVSLIMICYRLQLGELNWPWFSRPPESFLNANLC